MKHVTCQIQNDRVEIFRGWDMIGMVVATGKDEPVIMIFSNHVGVQSLSFNDIAIIQDNWNQYEEMLKKRLTCPENPVR